MSTALPVWAAVAAANRCSVADREAFAAWVSSRPVSTDDVALVTCHRVELYGVGSPPPAPKIPRLRWFDGEAAVLHVLRLAAGLESAVLGEDQVLHQVRVVLADLPARHGDARLIRLFELAVAVGRRVRAEGRPADRNLGELAARWLERRTGSLRGCRVIVAGAGGMGRLAAAAVVRRGAVATVASRSVEHAHQVAARIGADATDLLGAAAIAEQASAVIVALAGPWTGFEPRRALPLVDLSFPPAVPPDIGRALGEDFADVDQIFAEAASLSTDGAGTRDFRTNAEAVALEAAAAYAAWSAGRQSVATLRALRDRSEQHRLTELARLLRRLPDLDPRERDLVEAFSQRLVAGLLHEPSAALRDDADGTAAQAAERLFGL